MVHRRLLFTIDFSGIAYHFEVSIGDGSPRLAWKGGVYIFYKLAYQADQLYTIDVRPLTKAEKDRMLKEKLIYTGERLSLNFQDIEVRAKPGHDRLLKLGEVPDKESMPGIDNNLAIQYFAVH